MDTNFLDSASWELQQYGCRMCEPLNSPKLRPAPRNWTRDLIIVRLMADALPDDHTILTIDDLERQAFENIVGKGENAGFQYFLHFPQCFLRFLHKFQFFNHICFIAANTFHLDQSKILLFPQGLNYFGVEGLQTDAASLLKKKLQWLNTGFCMDL